MCPQRVSVIPGLSADREFLLISILAWPGTITLALHRTQVRFIWKHSHSIPVLKDPACFLWDDSWLSGQSKLKDTWDFLAMFPAGCVSPFESHPFKPVNLFNRKTNPGLFVLANPNLILQGHQRGQGGPYQWSIQLCTLPSAESNKKFLGENIRTE